jgi:nucleotide-binding universal stress UspA family protein
MISKHINNILIPVDFSESTGICLARALQFCREKTGVITLHLFHVQRITFASLPVAIFNFVSGYTREQVNTDLKKSAARLEVLKNVMEKTASNVQVECSVIFGEAVQDAIIKKARLLSPDLIIIGKKHHYTIFPFRHRVVPNKLASGTNIPVLTVRSGMTNKEIKTVVIPVSGRFPSNKLKVLEAINSSSKPHIRLVIFQNDTGEESKQCLLQTFRIIKNQLSNPVNYEVLEGKNRAKALLKYCRQVEADILIVNPGVETKVGNWTNSHISDFMPAGIHTQVLSVVQA